MKRTFGHKLFTLLLTVVMVLAMTVPALASTGGDLSIKLGVAYPNRTTDELNLDYIAADTSEVFVRAYTWTKRPSDGVVFGTYNVDSSGYLISGSFQPIPVSKLTASEGLTLEATKYPLHEEDDPYGDCYVTLRPDADGRDYTVSYQGLSITVTSKPWEVDIYREPNASLSAWREGYYNTAINFDPMHAAGPYYVSSRLTDEADGRHLSDLKLFPEWDTRVELNKVREGVYQLDFREGIWLEYDYFPICFVATWMEADGTVWSEYWPFTCTAKQAVVASDAPLVAEEAGYGAALPYTQAADKVTDTVTLTVGESREVYLYNLYYTNQGLGEQASWRAIQTRSGWFHTDDEELSLTPAGRDSAKFTLRGDKPGTYEIYLGIDRWDYDSMRLYHADGTLYTREEWEEFDKTVLCLIYADGTMEVQPVGSDHSGQVDYDKFVPFEEMFPGQRYELGYMGMTDFHGWRLTVNVENPSKDFADVPEDAWYRDELDYCVRKGLLQGTGESAFSPDGTAQRRAVVTTLHRMKGEPGAKGNSFTDVPAGEWYTAAVDWAAESGMVGGYEDNTFRPNKDVTRQELMVMLWRCARAEGYDVSAGADLSGYADGGQVADWARSAVEWAVSKGMLHTEGGRLDPGAAARRCDLAYALANLLQNG